MAMRCTSCDRVLDDHVDADEIFEVVSGWVSVDDDEPETLLAQR
jgi:hypothetical protein